MSDWIGSQSVQRRRNTLGSFSYSFIILLLLWGQYYLWWIALFYRVTLSKIECNVSNLTAIVFVICQTDALSIFFSKQLNVMHSGWYGCIRVHVELIRVHRFYSRALIMLMFMRCQKVKNQMHDDHFGKHLTVHSFWLCLNQMHRNTEMYFCC